MNALKDRTVNLSVMQVNYDDNNEIVGYTYLNGVDFFVKTINYDPAPVGVEHKGIAKTETAQWYSSAYTFKLTGDSYVSPFALPTLLLQDENIKALFALYQQYFSEDAFRTYGFGANTFQLTISNNPVLEDDVYIGVIKAFTCDETDENTGLIKFDITFEGKSSSKTNAVLAIDNFAKDLGLNSVNTLVKQANKLIGG